MIPDHSMWWPMAGMWVFPLFFFLIICVALMVIGRGGCRAPWRNSGSKHSQAEDNDDAIDILNKRYAKGEITKDEFEQMKKDILV